MTRCGMSGLASITLGLKLKHLSADDMRPYAPTEQLLPKEFVGLANSKDHGTTTSGIGVALAAGKHLCR